MRGLITAVKWVLSLALIPYTLGICLFFLGFFVYDASGNVGSLTISALGVWLAIKADQG
jgi:hypothetical protein